MTANLVRRLLILLGVICLGVILITTFGDLKLINAAFSHVLWYVVPMVVGAQLLSYLCDAGFYRSFFSLWERRVRLWQLYEISLATNFANVSIPSGGASGTAILAKSLQRDGYSVPLSNSALAQVCKYLFTYISFLGILLAGLMVLLVGDRLHEGSVRFALIVLGITLATGAIVGGAFSTKKRFERIVLPIIRAVNWLVTVVLRRKKPLIEQSALNGFLSEFYKDLAWVFAHKHRWPGLVLWSIGRNLAEILTIYVVFIGFGTWVNPGIVLTAYTLAIIASTVALPLSGIGAYEAGMVGAFVALGVPFALAFAVVVVYRTLNLGIFLPISFVFYRKYINKITRVAHARLSASA